jgi:hypothetical protein
MKHSGRRRARTEEGKGGGDKSNAKHLSPLKAISQTKGGRFEQKATKVAKV